jgi:hypothetical protein
MGAGAIVIVALIAAAAAATAGTVVRQATGSGADNANDAFGNWLKTFFISFAANSVGGAAGAAGEGASAGVDSGMYSGISDAGLNASISAELAKDGIGTAAAAQGAGATASTLAETGTAMAAEGISDVGAMVPEDISQYGADIQNASLTSQANTVMAEQAPSFLENLNFDSLNYKKDLFKWLSDSDDSVNSMFEYTNEADEATGLLGGEVSPEESPYMKQMRAFKIKQKQFGGLTNPFANQAETQAFEYGDLAKALGFETPEEEFAGSYLGQDQGSFAA